MPLRAKPTGMDGQNGRIQHGIARGIAGHPKAFGDSGDDPRENRRALAEVARLAHKDPIETRRIAGSLWATTTTARAARRARSVSSMSAFRPDRCRRRSTWLLPRSAISAI